MTIRVTAFLFNKRLRLLNLFRIHINTDIKTTNGFFGIILCENCFREIRYLISKYEFETIVVCKQQINK